MELKQTTLESYNKSIQQGQGTLIGNWKEERDLREATGIGRAAHNYGKAANAGTATQSSGFQTQSQQQLTSTGLFDKTNPIPTNDTSERCLGKKFNHIPKTVNSEYGQGVNKADSFPRVGADHVRTEKEMLELIKSELNEQERANENQRNTRYFQTTTQTEFGPKNHAMNDAVIGRRVMKTQNGQPIAPTNRDEDLLVDHGFLGRPQYLTDEEIRQRLPQGESYLTQQQVTLWSEKQDDGFGCVYKSHSNPQDPKSSFRLNNQFVKTFHDYSHVRK